MNNIEIYDNSDGKVRFYITHSDENFSTGIMIIKPDTSLPKHNRPFAVENLTQISGKCLVKVFDDTDQPNEYELTPGEGIRIEKAKYHIHSNPFNEISATLWLAEGNIVDIIDNIRKTYIKIN